MATNQRDEVLNIVVQASGDENIKNVLDAVSGLGTAAGIADPEIASLVDKIISLNATDKVVTALQSLNAQIETNGAKLAAAQQRVTDYNTAIAASGSATATQTAALAAAQKQVDSLTTSQGKLLDKAAGLTQTLTGQGVDVNNLGTAHAELAQKIQLTGSNIADLSNKTNIARDAYDGLKAKLVEVITVAAALDLAFKALAEVADFGKDQIANAAQVEASFARIQAIAGDTGQTLAEFNEKLDAAAEQVNVTTDAAATQLLALQKNGLSVNDAFNVLVPTLELAKVAQVDAGTAAAGLAESIKLYGLNANDAGHLIDVLTIASQGSAGGLASLLDALQKVAPGARQAGLDFDATATVLATLTKGGQSAENASRGLKAAFDELGSPASALRQELSSLGDNSADFQRAITAAGSSSNATKDVLATLSLQARQVFEVFLQQGPAAFAATKAAIDNASGSAATASTAIDKSLGGAFTTLTNAVERAGIQLALPILQPLEDELVKLASQITEFSKTDEFKELAKSIGDFATQSANDLNKFIAGINWGDLAKDAAKAVADANAELAKVSKVIGDAGAVLIKTGQTVSVGVSAIATSLDVLGGGATRLLDGLTLGLVPGLKEVGDSFQEDFVKNIDDTNAGINTLFNRTVDLTGGLRTTEQEASRAAAQFELLHGGAAVASASVGVLTEAAKTTADELGLIPDYTNKAALGFQMLGTQFNVSATSAQSLSSAYVTAVQHLKDLTDAGERNAQTLIDAQHAVEAAKGALDNYNGSLKVSNGLTDDQNAQLKAASDQVNKTYAALTQLSDATDRNQDAITAAGLAYGAAASKLEQLKLQFGLTKEASDALVSAFSTLKITSTADLQATADKAKKAFDTINAAQNGSAASFSDAQQAFISYSKTQLNAIAGLTDASSDQIRADLDQQASALDLVAVYKKLKDAQDAVSASGIKAADAAQKQADALAKLSANQDAVQKQAASVAASVANDFELGTTQLQSFTVSLNGLSNAALQALQNVQLTATALGQGQSVAPQYSQVLADGFNRIDAAIKQQQSSLVTLSAYYANFASTASQSDLDNAATLQKRADALAQFSGALKAGIGDLSLLDQSSLSGLEASVDAATSKVQALSDASKAAVSQLADLNNSLLDQIDQDSGNQADIENRRYQAQVAQIEALAKTAGAANEQQTDEILANAQKVHADALAKIQQEADAATAATKQTQQATSQAQQQAASPPTPAPSPQQLNPTITATINLLVPVTGGNAQAAGQLTSAQAQALADQLLSYLVDPMSSAIIAKIHASMMGSI